MFPGRRRSVASALGVVLTVVLSYLVLPVAPAAAAAGITLTKTAPTSVRAGAPITYALAAANPAANPDAVNEWNLAFRDLLPAGMAYVAGSTTPARAGEPTVITSASGTTLVWSNVADLQVNSTFELGYQAVPDPVVYPVGSTVTNAAEAHTNTDPFVSPEFDDAGVLDPATATESAADSATTAISAIDVTKSEPSPEGELLRGVHDHPTVYTLRVRATEAAGTAGVAVTDYLPAELEFLGCGGEDNSAGPEYPGAPLLTGTPAVPGCVAPDTVTTVTNPPPDAGTTFPPGVYTRLRWSLGDLAAGQEVVLRYAAGIPLRANAAWPPGSAPPTSGAQGANLDNNTGASTREGPSERSATNRVTLSGTYRGALAPGAVAAVVGSTTSTVSIEDLRMRKSVSPTTFQANGIARYTLVLDASEYTSASDVVITDAVPSGLCPLGAAGTNYAPSAPAECDGAAGTTPSVAYDSVTSQPDGGFTVVFQPVAVPASGSLTITYAARMLETYLGGPSTGQPTAVGDSFTNRASLSGTTTPIPLTGETGSVTVTDSSSATLSSGGAAPNKTMLARSLSGGTCPTDATAYRESADLPPGETRFREGDLVCFALRVDFSDQTRTRNPQVIDFLPPGFELVPGSARATPASTVPFSVQAQPTSIAFGIGTSTASGRYVPPGAVFEVVLQAKVVRGAPGPAAQVRTNLMKLGIEDTAGVRQSFRDTVALSVTPPPPLRVVKGVEGVDVPANGPNGPNSNVDGVAVQGGSVATFRVDVTHAGTAGGPDSAPVGGLDVWDVLPPGLPCSSVSNVRFGPAPASAPTVTCTDPGSPDQPSFTGSDVSSLLRVTWELSGDVAVDEIAPGERFSLLYDVTLPEPADVSTVYADTAHLRRYQQPTNVAGSVTPLYPKENVDPTVPQVLQTAPVARDGSSVKVRSPLVTKTGVTSITEQNNNTPNQATVGEVVTYRYAVAVPAETEVNSGSLTDALPAGIVPQPPATLTFYPDATQPGTATPPAGVVLDPATGQLRFGTEYANATGTDQRFEVLVSARVTTAAITVTQNSVGRTNTARFESLATPGGDPLAPITATYSVNLRQPRPALTKATDQPGPVPGGTLVTFTLNAANVNSDNSASNRPPLHDAFLVDCLPAGLIFEAYGANPGDPPGAGNGANGCPVGSTRLVWSLGDVAAGPAVTRSYTARLPLDAVGGDSYTNTAQLTGSSLDDGKTDPLAPDNPLERTYSANASATVTVFGTQLSKTVRPDRGTIGEGLTWTVATGALQNTSFFEASLIDRIPAGIADVRLESVECVILTSPVQPCGSVTGTALTPVPQADGSTLYGWTVGDVVVGNQPRGLIVTYSGRIADLPVNVAGRAVVNSAHTAWNITNGRTPGAADFRFDRQGAPDSATATVLEPSLTVAKSVSDATPDPTARFDYTVTVRNATGATVSAAHAIVVSDVVPVGVVVDPSSISAGGELTGADPATGGGTITWDAADLPGPLAPGALVELGYQAVLAPSAQLTGAVLVNTATVRSYASLPTGGRVYSGPRATARVTPQFPRVTTTKTAVDPAPAYIGDPFRWRVTVTNSGGSTAYGIDVTDTLPPGWEYADGTARVVVSGGGPQSVEPTVAGPALVWSDLGSIASGESVVVTFAAVPTADVVNDPGVGASVPQVNTARGTGVDASGATGSAAGPFSGPASTASTRIDSADLVLDKTHVEPFVAGADGTWRVAVSNGGPDVAVGPFHVTDTLPAGVSLVSATGPGWACTASGSVLDCTRLTPGEALAVGAGLPVLSVVVSLPAGTAPGTQLTNTAVVDGRTHDPNPANNTDSDTATVTASADLRIDKHHAVDPIAGERVTWALDVVNDGPSVAGAGTEVTDTLPAGLTYVSASGTGWSCAAVGQLVTCARSAPLPLGAAPQIQLVADVDSSVTGILVNTARVTGPTPDPNLENNTDTDRTPVVVLADLSIEKTHTNDFVAGAQGTYRLVVVNTGPSDAAAPVRITDTLPDGLTFVSSTDDEGTWSCSATGQDLTCDLSGPLAAGDQASLVVTVDIDPGLDLVRAPVTNTARVGSPTTDPNPENNVDSDTTNVDAVVDLAIAKSHTGTAVAGQTFDWTLAVTNNGPSTTPGPIVVTDPVPAGASFVSASGTGWTCSEDAALVRCESGTSLPPGADATPITVTLLVLPSAGPGTITNLADVSGPIGDPNPENNTDSDTVTVRDETDVAIAKETVGPGTVDAGDTVAFDLTVTNNGPSDADAVVVRDSLPPGTTPVSVTPPDGDGWVCVTLGREVTCARATMPASVGTGPPTTSVIRVVARVAASVADGTVLTNTARVSTATPGDLEENNTATSTVRVETSADLTLTKTHQGTDPVRAGTTTTFAIDVENLGPSDAQGPLTVTDTLPTGLTFVSAGAPWVCAPSVGDAQVVVCETPDAAPLPAGGTAAPLVLTVAVDAATAPGPYTNSATVSSITRDPNPDNDTGTAVAQVVQSADVSIVKTPGEPVRVGDQLTFTLAVANAGPSQAGAVVVSDHVPDGLTFVSATGDGWACAEVAAVVTCDLAAPLGPGDRAEDISLVVTVEPGAFPSVDNTATVTSTTPDPDPANNSSTTTVAVPPLVDLAIDKSHTGGLTVGTDATWTLDVTNAGPTDDPGPLTVVDTVPDGLRPLGATGDGWSCSTAGQVVTCTSDTGLAMGDRRTITLTTAVEPSAFPSVTNTATVGSPAEDLDPTNNVDTDSADVSALSRLVISKELSDQSAGSGTFRIIVTNQGPNDTTAPIVVTDTLPEGMTPVRAGGPGWSCGIVQATVTCQYPDAVVVDDSTSALVVEARVTAAPGTALVNVAVVEGGQPNPCSTCGGSDQAALVVPVDDLAHTGSDLVRLALLALALVGAGLLLVRSGRTQRD